LRKAGFRPKTDPTTEVYDDRMMGQVNIDYDRGIDRDTGTPRGGRQFTKS
jgi:hypothetical protein